MANAEIDLKEFANSKMIVKKRASVKSEGGVTGV